MDTLVGHRYSRHRIEFPNIVFSLIYGMLDVTGSLQYDPERFDGAWSRFIASLEVDRIETKIVAVIPHLALPGGSVRLNGELELDVLTDEEATRCERLGILRPLSPTFPVIMSEEAIGFRLTQWHEKVVGEEMNHASSTAGTFGIRTFLYPHLLVEDVMCLLRLFKLCLLKCAGYASYTDWKWLAGGTAFRVTAPHVVGETYQLSVGEHEALQELWELLVRFSSPFDFALRRFSLAFDRESIYDRIVDIVVAAESLFLGDLDVRDRGELRFRFALRASWFIEHPTLDRRTIFSVMRRAYDARSAIVHGGTPNDTRVPGNDQSSIGDFALLAAELVRLSLRKALELTKEGGRLRDGRFWSDLVLPE